MIYGPIASSGRSCIVASRMPKAWCAHQHKGIRFPPLRVLRVFVVNFLAKRINHNDTKNTEEVTFPTIRGARENWHNAGERSVLMGRRIYTREFKVSAVKLVQEQGYTVCRGGQESGRGRHLDPQLAEEVSARKWAVRPNGDAALRAELRRLREENKRLLMEREILKKATAFFAKQQP